MCALRRSKFNIFVRAFEVATNCKYNHCLGNMDHVEVVGHFHATSPKFIDLLQLQCSVLVVQ